MKNFFFTRFNVHCVLNCVEKKCKNITSVSISTLNESNDIFWYTTVQ